VSAPTASLRQWQGRVFWLLWGAYASYYLCRVNFAVAQPAILKEFPSWTSAQIGMIPSTYAMFYAAGQLINGALGQRYGARRLMTMALSVALVTNLLFAFTSSYRFMLVLWAINGYAQSAGWSLLVQTISNWHTSKRRGTVIGLISTCYQVGNVISWVLAGTYCEVLNWRAAFWVPSLILVPVTIAFHLGLRNSPEEAGLPAVRDDGVETRPATAQAGEPAPQTAGWGPTWQLLVLTLSNRVLWVLGLGYFCMNSVRYTFMNWTVQYMTDYHHSTIRGGAFKAVVIPLVGALGAVGAGWLSDTVFGKRRAPVCALMLIGLAGVCAAFTLIPQGRWGVATVLLGLAGFLIYGPDMLMSGAATVDVSHPKAASIATGFTMSLGASGSILSGAGVGKLIDLTKGNWAPLFWVLAGLALVSALLMVSIWNARPKGAR
jgi:sugar phosphate permease